MSLRKKLFSNMILRNMLADFGSRSGYSTSSKEFTPYFQYKVGAYQSDFYLYFPKEPFVVRYKNEVFNKLFEYSGYDIIRFLEFHYSSFPDKNDFLRFLHYEIAERKKITNKNKQLIKLEATLEWIHEKKEELKTKQEKGLRQQLEEEIKTTLSTQPATEINIEEVSKILSEKFSTRIDALMAGAEEKLLSLKEAFTTGNIELGNSAYLNKLIQVQIMVMQLKAPGKVEQLFKRYSFIDLATVLNLHYETFKGKKLNTIQVEVKNCNENIDMKNEKWKKLEAAMVDFVYG